VARRVSPTERLRAEIDELFAVDRELASILEDVARLSVRSMLQAPWRLRSSSSWVALATSGAPTRAGSVPARLAAPAAVATTMGPVKLQRPKLRGTDQAFSSRLSGVGVTHTHALESLVISGWVRGLSDRDIEAALAEVLGAEAALSKSTVSRICQRIREEFETWRHRDLGALRLNYLFLDGSHFMMVGWPMTNRRAGCTPAPAPGGSPSALASAPTSVVTAASMLASVPIPSAAGALPGGHPARAGASATAGRRTGSRSRRRLRPRRRRSAA
jgi:hypothetical protein